MTEFPFSSEVPQESPHESRKVAETAKKPNRKKKAPKAASAPKAPEPQEPEETYKNKAAKRRAKPYWLE